MTDRDPPPDPAARADSDAQFGRERASLRDAFRQTWEEMVAGDADEEADFNLLAAYAEGRLTADEAQAVEARLSESPRDFELHASLSGSRFTQPHPRVDRLPTTGSNPPAPSRGTATLAVRWALAGCVLIAAGLQLRLLTAQRAISSLRGQVAQLQEAEADLGSIRSQLADTALELAQARKSQLATLAADVQPVYVTGRISRDLLLLSLRQRETARGPTSRTRFEQQQVESVLQDAQRNLQIITSETPSDTHAGRQEAISLLILAHRLEEADAALDELAADAPPEDPEIDNLRAVLLLTEAEEAVDPESLLGEAERLLRRAGAAGLASAWLNLRQLLLAEGRTDEADDALTRFLDLSPDAEIQSAVRAAIAPE